MSIFNVLLSLIALVASYAAGHIVPSIKVGESDSSFTTGFKVGHGCDDADTSSIEIKMPQGVYKASALQLAGYEISSTRRPLSPPKTLYGKQLNETVDTFTFTGILKSDQFQYFTISMKLPTVTQPTELSFHVIQTCGDTSRDWIGDASSDSPAPIITVYPEGSSATSSAIGATYSVTLFLSCFVAILAMSQ